MKLAFPFDFSQEKSLLLRETRKVSFEDIIEAIQNDRLLDDLKHSSKKYPRQRIFIVLIKGYVYVVPYIIDRRRKVIFLKTLYPSRKLTKKHMEKRK